MRVFRVFRLMMLALPALAHGQLQLPNLFSDHAVIQRERPIRVWGWAAAGDKVSVSFHDQRQTTQADAVGEWELWLNRESAGGPYILAVSSGEDGQRIDRKDILVGDVWFASGQSNMQFPLNGFPRQQAPLKDGPKEIAAANHPEIRLLFQKNQTSIVPLSEGSGTWTLCTPEIASSFSAVAYFFGRELSEMERVPIGLIDATWGGTPAHSWISLDSLGSANLFSVNAEMGKIARDQARAGEIRADYARQDDAAKAAGKPAPQHPPVPNDHGGSWMPGTLFNGMIAPYTHYAIKGVIWYQGESDTDPQRAPYYDRVFPTLIGDWRRQWGEGDFPFLYVQISSFATTGDSWGRVRDAQRKALSLRNTGMAVTLDVGQTNNIHPPDKQTVAHRLALAAREIAYGERIDSSSPTFVEASTEAKFIRAWFTHADGLATQGQQVVGFEVAGEDRVYKPATAIIEKVGASETVLVTSPDVTSPRFVRYGWGGAVSNYFYNSAQLPLGTFTSEP